jgi:hypothetical protein
MVLFPRRWLPGRGSDRCERVKGRDAEGHEVAHLRRDDGEIVDIGGGGYRASIRSSKRPRIDHAQCPNTCSSIGGMFRLRVTCPFGLRSQESSFRYRPGERRAHRRRLSLQYLIVLIALSQRGVSRATMLDAARACRLPQYPVRVAAT